MEERSVGVVLPAAGKGLRLGGARKQFRLLDGKPLLYWSARIFDAHPAIEAIVVVAPADGIEQARDSVDRVAKVCAVVPGGRTRQASVQRGLEALPGAVDSVLIHDAVRPFVTSAMVSAVVETIRQDGAGALAIPVADTLRAAMDGRFAATVPRDGLYRMQTPQGARRAWLSEAFARATAEGWQATDDVDLLQRAGFEVPIVEGSALNFKITTPADWDMARSIWPIFGQSNPDGSD